MQQKLIVVLAVVYCIATSYGFTSDEDATYAREVAELKREQLEAAELWEDILTRKLELARDQKGSTGEVPGWNVAQEEKNLEEYLTRRQVEVNLERRQSGGNCIQGDVIFILDSSGSIGIQNWKLVLTFVNEAIKRMTVGPQATRVGLVTYGNKAHIIFNLNNFTSSSQMEQAVNNAKFLDENTNTSGGIYVARSVMFTQANGERPKAPNMAIVITDGESTYDHDKTIPYAKEAKAQGILFISIGVGDKVSKGELDGIASPGGDGKPLVFQVGSYDMLKNIQDTLATVACDPVATQAPPCVPSNDIVPTVYKDCDSVTCKNKCQYGFAQDSNNCLTCGCLPKRPVCP